MYPVFQKYSTYVHRDIYVFDSPSFRMKEQKKPGPPGEDDGEEKEEQEQAKPVSLFLHIALSL